ncbi:MAG: homocysteine S-methyltransferase [Pseudonocardiales bacterium]|nr:homocysteine S-methyltransferase [Pseudonocardiales bacterium]
MASLGDAVRERVVVLDGGLATELERRGHDLSSDLWSARLLRDAPDEIVAAHRAFAAAGAEVAITASYQVSFERLGDDAELLLRRSVELARRAGPEWVAASVGPYGAMLADGSEYRGDYGLSVAQLRRFHRRRLGVLADAGADVLAIETIPCLAEVEAILAELDDLGAEAWLSLSCVGRWTRAGEPAEEAFAMARDCASVFAVGVNCTTPADVPDLVALAKARSGKPAVAYPNSGEVWDAARRAWSGRSAFDPSAIQRWVGEGARLVGGCCRVGPPDVVAITEAIRPR